jgi:hypothetical protein
MITVEPDRIYRLTAKNGLYDYDVYTSRTKITWRTNAADPFDSGIYAAGEVAPTPPTTQAVENVEVLQPGTLLEPFSRPGAPYRVMGVLYQALVPLNDDGTANWTHGGLGNGTSTSKPADGKSYVWYQALWVERASDQKKCFLWTVYKDRDYIELAEAPDAPPPPPAPAEPPVPPPSEPDPEPRPVDTRFTIEAARTTYAIAEMHGVRFKDFKFCIPFGETGGTENGVGNGLEQVLFGARLSKKPASEAKPWEGLISFRPSPDVQRHILFYGGKVHKIEDGWGPINLDRYEVAVTKLPKIDGAVATPEKVLAWLRLNINQVLNKELATFSDEQASPVSWDSSNPLGAILHIAMKDDGSVICSEYSARHWIFSTLWTKQDWEHPVSGNREFGFKQEDSRYVFYTRGADRATEARFWLAGDFVFDGGDKLWRSFQDGFRNWVSRNEGAAEIREPFSERFDWKQIKPLYHNPSVPWILSL